MRKSRDVARLTGSTPTGVGLNYPSLIGLQINIEGLVTAFNHLALMGSNYEITNNFARLCLVLSEASRFELIGTQFGHALGRNDNIVVNEWIHDLVKNWLWRRSQNLLLMSSGFYSDDVTTFYDGVTLAYKEKPLEDSTVDSVRKP
ncbi:ribonuclease H-like domain-containing protein [Tanacetum coccineum]